MLIISCFIPQYFLSLSLINSLIGVNVGVDPKGKTKSTLAEIFNAT